MKCHVDLADAQSARFVALDLDFYVGADGSRGDFGPLEAEYQARGQTVSDCRCKYSRCVGRRVMPKWRWFIEQKRCELLLVEFYPELEAVDLFDMQGERARNAAHGLAVRVLKPSTR